MCRRALGCATISTFSGGYRGVPTCVCDPLLPPFLHDICMTFCLSSELSVMQVMNFMLSFFSTGVDIKVIVLPAQGQGLPILKSVSYFTLYTGMQM